MLNKEMLLESLKRENTLNKIIIELAKVEDNPDRLLNMLKGLNIGAKKRYIDQLTDFVNYGNTGKDFKKEERNKYLEGIKEFKKTLNEAEKVITQKLGIEGVKKEEQKRDNKNNFADFQEEFIDLSLLSSLDSIKSSNKTIQTELEGLRITENNKDRIADILDNIEGASVEWLMYLKSQKKQKKFYLTEDMFMDMFDETIIESKRTLEMIKEKREEMQNRFPDWAQTREEEKRQQREDENSEEPTVPEYDEEDINIQTVRSKTNAEIYIKRSLLKKYRMIPENFRDVLEKIGKDGFSSKIGYTILGIMASDFLRNNGERSVDEDVPVRPPHDGPPPPPPPPPMDFGER